MSDEGSKANRYIVYVHHMHMYMYMYMCMFLSTSRNSLYSAQVY